MAYGGEFQAAKINAAVESKLPSLSFCSVQAADVSTEQQRVISIKEGSGRSSVRIELLSLSAGGPSLLLTVHRQAVTCTYLAVSTFAWPGSQRVIAGWLGELSELLLETGSSPEIHTQREVLIARAVSQ